MPHTLCQWLAYIFVVGVGTLVSWGLQALVGKVLLEPVKLELDLRERVKKLVEKLKEESKKRKMDLQLDESVKPPAAQPGHLGTGLQEWVGTIEIIIYASSVVFEHPEFIAVWFATKYVAAYKTWAEEPVGRTFYNRSLFGSGLNIVIGFFTGKFALWLISLVGPVPPLRPLH
jgi:hypothetical protein